MKDEGQGHVMVRVPAPEPPAGGLKAPAPTATGRLRGLRQPAQAGALTIAGGFSRPAGCVGRP